MNQPLNKMAKQLKNMTCCRKTKTTIEFDTKNPKKIINSSVNVYASSIKAFVVIRYRSNQPLKTWPLFLSAQFTAFLPTIRVLWDSVKMTMYFDFKVNTKPKTQINCMEWHQQLSLLAVGLCFRSPLQSFISVFDQLVIRLKFISNSRPIFAIFSWWIWYFLLFFSGWIFARCEWVPVRKQANRMYLMASLKKNSSRRIFFWWYSFLEWSTWFCKLGITTFSTRCIFEMVWTRNETSFYWQSKLSFDFVLRKSEIINWIFFAFH